MPCGTMPGRDETPAERAGRLSPPALVGIDTVVIPALSRNPFSSADGTGGAPSFPARGYRVQALRS
ncbi:MAG: hypothetical protein OXL41_10460, partial [Nitrospinae bacterium]|nr:hypothetical protein [Nitrospinota bacterium]